MPNESDFETFWKKWPRKIARAAAEKAYTRARRVASASVIYEGVLSYIEHKPSWQEWAHATTWLNQQRWTDEWEAPPKPLSAALPAMADDWYGECQRLHDRRCNGQYGHWIQMQIDSARVSAANDHGE